jgi:hypothetical protein
MEYWIPFYGTKVDLPTNRQSRKAWLSTVINFVEDTVLHKAPCDVLAVRVSHGPR